MTSQAALTFEIRGCRLSRSSRNAKEFGKCDLSQNLSAPSKSAVRHRQLPAGHAILDVIGYLLTNRCQVEKLLFYGSVFSRFGKLPIFGRFVAQIIGPIHVAPSFHTRTRAAILRLRSLLLPSRHQIICIRRSTLLQVGQMCCLRRQRKRTSTMLGVQPCQPRVLKLSGVFTRFLVRSECMG